MEIRENLMKKEENYKSYFVLKKIIDFNDVFFFTSFKIKFPKKILFRRTIILQPFKTCITYTNFAENHFLLTISYCCIQMKIK